MATVEAVIALRSRGVASSGIRVLRGWSVCAKRCKCLKIRRNEQRRPQTIQQRRCRYLREVSGDVVVLIYSSRLVVARAQLLARLARALPATGPAIFRERLPQYQDASNSAQTARKS
jgi:hypothetical protein